MAADGQIVLTIGANETSPGDVRQAEAFLLMDSSSMPETPSNLPQV
jgi:hypothetical protein